MLIEQHLMLELLDQILLLGRYVQSGLTMVFSGLGGWTFICGQSSF